MQDDFKFRTVNGPMTASAVDLHAIEIVLLVLLCAIVIVAGLARKFSISYPIVLVVAGLISGLIPAIPNVPLSPHVVFLVFLPPLLFSAAWQTSWREFRFNLVSIS